MKKIFTILLAIAFTANLSMAQAPDFTFTDTKGNQHNLQHALDQGYIVLLDFFFYDCPPCNTTAPWIGELLTTEFEGKNVIMWSFSDRDSDELIDQFEENHGLPGYGSGPAGDGDDVIDLYAANYTFLGFPTYSVVCPDGSITWDIWPLSNGAPEIATALNGCGVEDAAASYEPQMPNSTEDIQFASTKLTVFPNPVNEVANINLDLNETADVSITVFDVLGRDVQTVFDGQKSKGSHALTVETADFQSGAYFVKMVVDGEKVVTTNFVKQ